MESDPIEEYLHNWASWARSRQIIPCSCRSLESRHVSTEIWNPPEARHTIDLNQALYIERLLVNGIPKSSMAAIVYAYVYPWRRIEGALRKINGFKPPRYVKPNTFNDFLNDSKRMLSNRVRFDCCITEKSVLASINNLITAEMRACHPGEALPESTQI